MRLIFSLEILEETYYCQYHDTLNIILHYIINLTLLRTCRQQIIPLYENLGLERVHLETFV